MSSKFTPKIVRKKLSEVDFAPYNPRTISPQERERLKKSLDKFGYADLMVYNKKTGYIVGGNQRLAIFKELGINQLDFIEVDLSLEDEKILNVALNKISGEWDMLKLRDIFKELSGKDFDLDLTGFEQREVDAMLMTLPDFDPDKAWEGMPEYNMQDLNGRVITVHFKTEEDVQNFAKAIGQAITDKTHYLWYPYLPPERNSHLRYKSNPKPKEG